MSQAFGNEKAFDFARKMCSHVGYTLTLEFDQLNSCQRRPALTDVLAETGTGLGLGGAVI